jgi:Helix-turn-helix domain
MSNIDTVAPMMGDALLASLVKAVLPKVAQAILGIGRSKMYELLGKGDLDAVKDGPTRILITTESIARYQANRPPAVFKQPKPPRLENLDRLHAKQREERARRRAARRRRVSAFAGGSK